MWLASRRALAAADTAWPRAQPSTASHLKRRATAFSRRSRLRSTLRVNPSYGVLPMQISSTRFVLRDLSLPSRLVVALFLVSVGLGYFSALVQLHFQLATAGNLLPGQRETIDAYHGRAGISQLERLLRADESQPFNGTGSMRQAFF